MHFLTFFAHPHSPSALSGPPPGVAPPRLEPLEDRRMLSVLFVNDDATASGDGLSWGSAFDDLQGALERATTLRADGDPGNDVDEIWIAEGVYKPSAELEPGDPRSASFSLVDGVTLYGGFSATETTLAERDWSANETVLSGDLGVAGDEADNAFTVVYCGEGVEAGVDGVTVTEGNADDGSDDSTPEREWGGGIYNAGSLSLINSVVKGNQAIRGGGAANCDGTLMLGGSTFHDNESSGSGGAIFNNDGCIDVEDSTFLANTSHWGGGAIVTFSGAVNAVRSTFIENASDDCGGGICSWNTASVSVTHSIFRGNRADNGGGIYTRDDSILIVENAEFSGNSAIYNGGGICSYGVSLSVSNSTLAGNYAGNAGGICATGVDSANNLVNSLVSLNVGGDVLTCLSEESTNNLIGIDPEFTRDPSHGGDGWGDNPDTPGVDESLNDDYGDLRLSERSFAIDMGSNALIPSDTADVDKDGNITEAIPFDLGGGARIHGLSVDVGAYEFDGNKGRRARGSFDHGDHCYGRF